MTEETTLPIRAAKAPATVNVIVREAADGYVEIFIDVSGAFVFRDKLKAHGFQFVRDRSVGMETVAPLDRNGNRKRSAVWRRMIVAVPPDASAARAVTGIEHAVDTFSDLLNGVLDGSRIKGANSAALKIAERWKEAEGISDLAKKLSALDTPWQPGPTHSETIIRRPAFAA